jgi:Rieske Fe-S protein
MQSLSRAELAPAYGKQQHLFYTTLFFFLLLALAGCSGSGDGAINLISEAKADEEPQTPANSLPQLRPASSASEYVGIATGTPMEEEQILAVLSQLLGADAAGGAHLMNFELQPGIMLSSADDSRTSEQLILQVDMAVSNADVVPAQRTLFRGPASYAYGAIFVDVVAAALQELRNNSDGMRPFTLEYRSRSALGGQLAVIVDFAPDSGVQLKVDVNTPRTSLIAGNINQPYLNGAPFESIYGLVNFSLSRDQFDFFSTRAYGLSAGANQNFNDFLLLPHRWLRLTVTPLLDDLTVDVGFEVVTVDGRRLDIARAPASVIAGEQFREAVFRMVDNMNNAEKRMPGSSIPWSVPFYYDDPAGGGVVEVLAQGSEGQFRIAYAVETPINQLQDTEFVAYQGQVEIPENWDAARPTCEDLGSVAALDGNFELRFNASSTVRKSDNLDGPLRGTVVGSIFRAEDVTITGPIEGAEAVYRFRFDDVDVTSLDGSPDSYRIPVSLGAGDYQILGFMDIDGNEALGDGGPDVNDPVMIPIGAYAMECASQPITVEFAILLPDDF